MLLARYARWLHTGWPAGTVEPLPEVAEDGATAVPGVRVVGDLTGVPLLKLAVDSGARAARAIAVELAGASRAPDVVDVAIVGGGVSGIAAALEAKALGLSFVVFEAARPFSTIVNFPREKPIFTYPTALRPAGGLALTAQVKEALVLELEAQRAAAGVEPVLARIERIERGDGELRLRHADGATTTRARRVIVAIGRSGDFRRLGVPGEGLAKVMNRLHDPAVHAGQDVLVVGGGDSAVEAAVALARAGARVTLAHRQAALTRPKPGNVAALEALAKDGALTLALGARVQEVRAREVLLAGEGAPRALANDVVFAMLGREAPLDFFRRSGIPIRGEWTRGRVAAFVLFLLLCAAIYIGKNTAPSLDAFSAADPATALGTLAVSARSPSFYYTLAYTALVTAFGVVRIRKRRTPYVTAQTLTLMAVQALPLFLLPELVLPWLGYNGAFSDGVGRTVADALFPSYGAGQAWPHPRAYWQAYGLILAWPLFAYNALTASPSTAWLTIGFVQTFVLIPLLVWRWGKGAYCGWICSCGALAETLGDAQRAKMPHGPGWNRLNLVGQGILALAFALLGLRVVGWVWPGGWAARAFAVAFDGGPLSYKWIVDVGLAGIVGVGCYFWLSGRVWCRFACPLAALMHIYARFSRFRIFAEKARCISCNVCTSVCHQGIDVMSVANKGLPVQDPQCVRCSACVQACPTGTLSFGRVGGDGQPVLDRLAASPVQLRERAVRALPIAR